MKQRLFLSIIAVTCTLLFSGYGQAEPQQKPLSSNTNQAISFNGISLGKPGIKEALQKLCTMKKFNIMLERCVLTEKSSMILLDYESMVDAIATVTLSSDMALVKVVIDGSTQDMLALAKALEKKYGAPMRKSAIIKKSIGTQLDEKTFGVKEVEGFELNKEIFFWQDDQGSRITVESVYSDYDKGGIAIESSLAATQNSATKATK